ncbi:unnamed protein product [Periconia digitata]|uniref:Aromatic prenyltransferase n=1 Tax=Periconia digitata TaxID=1303443 RepID=A0A9W4U5L5_9PLEO|nr:unnamed protein product [Periconia digitata]
MGIDDHWSFSDADYHQTILEKPAPDFPKPANGVAQSEILNSNLLHSSTDDLPDFEALTKTLVLTSEDDTFWWHATAYPFYQLIVQNGYESEQCRSLLRWYAAFIIPALGPRPIQGVKPLFQPCPVPDGSSVEHSLNWKEKSSKRLVRFTIEATGRSAGTTLDPFNQDEAVTLLSKLQRFGKMPNLDLGQFDIWKNRFFIDAQTAPVLLPKLPSGLPLSQIWVAFDFPHSHEPMAKVYFMPSLSSMVSGIPNYRLVFETARRCNGRHGNYDTAIGVLDTYLTAYPTEPVIMAALDCVDSPDSRIKVYVQTSANTFNSAKRVLTLNGKRSGETVQKGLEALGELWSIIFGPDKTNDGDSTVFSSGVYCGLAVELKADQDLPETKLHLPVRNMEGTDADLCHLLSTWFQKRGHGTFGAGIQTNLARAFPHHDLNGPRGTYTFVSFSYSAETGVYMTMYYSTRIFDSHLGVKKENFWQGYDSLWGKWSHDQKM